MRGRELPETDLPRDPGLAALVRDGTTALLDRYPMWATDLGFRAWDERLGDLSPHGRFDQSRHLQRLRRSLEGVDRSTLTPDDRVDAALLAHAVELALDEESDPPLAACDPTVALSYVTGGLTSLLRYRGQPDEARTASLVARLKQVGPFLQGALSALENPSRLAAQTAVEEAEALARTVESGLGRGWKRWGAGHLDVQAAAKKATGHLRQFANHLTNGHLSAEPVWLADAPAGMDGGSGYGRGNRVGDFRIGRDRIRRRLIWQDHEDWDLVRLLQGAYDRLSSERDTLARLLTETRPGGTPVEAVTRIRAETLTGTELVEAFRYWMGKLRTFLGDGRLFDPSRLQWPQVESAEADCLSPEAVAVWGPGPFDPDGPTALRVPPGLQAHRWTVPVDVVRGTFAGNHLRDQPASRPPRRWRRIIPAPVHHDGFAAYVETLLAEAGFFRADARYGAAVALHALARTGRLITAIRLHSEDITLKQAVQFLVDQCFMSPEDAHVSAVEAALHPLTCMTLAQEMAWEASYRGLDHGTRGRVSRRGFHDAMFAQGYVPLPTIRTRLLQEDSSRDTTIHVW